VSVFLPKNEGSNAVEPGAFAQFPENLGTKTMGLAAYEIIGNDAEWRG
jgi:hypothetical protein